MYATFITAASLGFTAEKAVKEHTDQDRHTALLDVRCFQQEYQDYGCGSWDADRRTCHILSSQTYRMSKLTCAVA